MKRNNTNLPLIIVLMGGPFPALDLFAQEMVSESDAHLVDTRHPEDSFYPLTSQINKKTVVITFNSLGAPFELWKQRKVQLYNIMVDHPAHFLNAISRDYYPGYHAVLIDRGHQAFLKKVFANISSAFCFMPHGGAYASNAHKNKDIDILYAGSFKAESEINFAPLPFDDSEAFFDHVISYYNEHTYMEAQDAVMDYMKTRDKDYSPSEMAVMTNYTVRSAEYFFTAERRKGLIRHLAKCGFKVHVIGGKSWENIAREMPDRIIYEGMKSPYECIGFIDRAKILLNDLPYFSEGSHERVFNGMMNKAVVLSNESRYLEERFEDGESILFWNGKDFEMASEKIERVLGSEEYRDYIVRNAYELTRNDTWRDRLDMITSGIIDDV